MVLAATAVAYLVALAPGPERDTETPRSSSEPAGLAQALRDDLAALRLGLEELHRRDRQLEQRLAELEAAFGPVTAALPRGQGGPSGRPVAPATVRMLPMPADGFADTGFEASPLPVAAAAPTTTQFAVAVAQGRTATELRVRWKSLQSLHPTLLGSLEARQAATSDGALRLLAGPFRNAAQAAALCARLQSAAPDCTATAFLGAPLGSPSVAAGGGP